MTDLEDEISKLTRVSLNMRDTLAQNQSSTKKQSRNISVFKFEQFSFKFIEKMNFVIKKTSDHSNIRMLYFKHYSNQSC